MSEATPCPPELAARKALVACCQKRVGRAQEKLRAAQAEVEAALDGLDAASSRLAQWIAENPDPQRSIFEELSNV